MEFDLLVFFAPSFLVFWMFCYETVGTCYYCRRNAEGKICGQRDDDRYLVIDGSLLSGQRIAAAKFVDN